MRKYVKLPVEVEAIQWTGGNAEEVRQWVSADFYLQEKLLQLFVAANRAWLELEVGEWIIKDDIGFYPCKDSVFRTTYKAVDDE